MLYVVLYGGLLCLPHDRKGKDLLNLLNSFFDDYSSSTGSPFGGLGKSNNLLNRAITNSINWKAAGMSIWVNTMYGALDPIVNNAARQGRIGYTVSTSSPMWNPESVSSWWKTFLVEYYTVLETNNRVDNIRANWDYFKNRAPNILRTIPNQGTHASPVRESERGDATDSRRNAWKSIQNSPTLLGRRRKRSESPSHSESSLASYSIEDGLSVPTATGSRHSLPESTIHATDDDGYLYSPIVDPSSPPPWSSDHRSLTSPSGTDEDATRPHSQPRKDREVVPPAKKKARHG